MVVGFTITYAVSVLSPLMLWVWIPLGRGVLDTTLCDKVCQWFAKVDGFLQVLRFPPSIAEILKKMVLNTVSQIKWQNINCICFLKKIEQINYFVFDNHNFIIIWNIAKNKPPLNNFVFHIIQQKILMILHLYRFYGVLFLLFS